MELRPLQLSDARVMAGWASDPEFCRQAGWSPTRSAEDYLRFHEHLVMSPPPELLRLAAVLGGELVGYVDLHGEDVDRRELGFCVGGRQRWGQGLGTQAAAAGLGHGFGELGLQEVWAEALDANRRSVRILQRIGMHETERGEDDLFVDRPSYHRRFEITVGQWRHRGGCGSLTG